MDFLAIGSRRFGENNSRSQQCIIDRIDQTRYENERPNLKHCPDALFYTPSLELFDSLRNAFPGKFANPSHEQFHVLALREFRTRVS